MKTSIWWSSKFCLEKIIHPSTQGQKNISTRSFSTVCYFSSFLSFSPSFSYYLHFSNYSRLLRNPSLYWTYVIRYGSAGLILMFWRNKFEIKPLHDSSHQCHHLMTSGERAEEVDHAASRMDANNATQFPNILFCLPLFPVFLTVVLTYS
jgi:hypothetical protein